MMLAAAVQAVRARIAFLVLVGLFLASGVSALIYQTAWQRMLGLFGGSDSISATLVVGAFLFGLGIGSLAAGNFADRLSSRRAVRAFALCEFGIAAFGALSPWLFHDLLFARLAPLAETRGMVFVMLVLGLVWPTTLMGMSLPLLAKAIVRRIEGSATRIGWLYGLNTIGAGAGALLAGWYLVGTVGYGRTVLAAAVLNALIGAAALLVAPWLRTDDAAPRAAGGPAADVNATVRRWCALMLVSGFVIISLEIVWFRVIGLMLQSNAYTFALVLTVFLLGDGLGIVAGAHWIRRIADPTRAFLAIQAAVALYAIGAIWALHAAYTLPAFTEVFVENDAFRDLRRNLPMVLLTTAALVFPPAFLLGLSFPLAQKAVQTDPALVGRRVGLIQVFNILGNSAGAFVTGLILLHWLGTAGTLRLIAGIGLLFATVLLIGAVRAAGARGLGWATAAVWIGLAVTIAAFPANARFWARMHGIAPGFQALVAEDHAGVALLRLDAEGRGAFFISGWAQAHLPYADFHGLLGAVGPLVHPDPKRVMLIGVGGGATPYAAGVRAGTERIRAVEIVGAVFPVLDRMRSIQPDGPIARMRSDPRYEWVFADGRRDLFVSGETFDVIEADATLPKSSHSGMIYSVEFFRQVRARLNPGGIAVQWAATPRVERTFAAVFPHVLRISTLLLGSDRPIPFDPQAFQARLAEPAVRAYLLAGGYCCSGLRWLADERIEARYDPATPRASGDINTDLFPKDEYYLNR